MCRGVQSATVRDTGAHPVMAVHPAFVHNLSMQKSAALYIATSVQSALLCKTLQPAVGGQTTHLDPLHMGLHFVTMDCYMNVDTGIWNEKAMSKPSAARIKLDVEKLYAAQKLRDGVYVMLTVVSDKEWASFCHEFDEEFKNEPFYPKLMTDWKELINRIKPDCLATMESAILQLLAKISYEELERRGTRAHIPFAKCNSLDEAISDVQAVHNKLFEIHELPGYGLYRSVRPTALFNDTPTSLRRPPPMPGQHTDEVLQNLIREHAI
eukprot:m.87515 g.87515  ORF g.87515 m.87515 type:complete len:267 (+) comp16409_c0_seq6:188-988(+)